MGERRSGYPCCKRRRFIHFAASASVRIRDAEYFNYGWLERHSAAFPAQTRDVQQSRYGADFAGPIRCRSMAAAEAADGLWRRKPESVSDGPSGGAAARYRGLNHRYMQIKVR